MDVVHMLVEAGADPGHEARQDVLDGSSAKVSIHGTWANKSATL